MPAYGKSKKKSALRRATSAVKRLFMRSGGQAILPVPADNERTGKIARPPQETTAKPVKRETDIPLDVLNATYTPPVTSSKASFRSDGIDHQMDQEFARGRDDHRWNDEDHYTNKSGDPRIGTHRRTHEPDEERTQ